ncbi:CoA transferase [Rhodococcus opacus]|uniref:Dehydratase n=1 Tax=Rhodococcus opacus TaxID=37919 RepID=A0A076ENB5_RHOOP|nr:CoA transferase [Rhodococcus opacus]AII07595.1 dehydratase [Rhodococcus opacus]
MNAGPLAGLRVVEVSAFVAAPLSGMTLAQLGAEVIRIDPIGGNIDVNRWPLTAEGSSIYWSSLNKGKRSITLDLKTEAGQRLATELICAPGEGAGIVVTNLPGRGWLDYDSLRAQRADVIVVTLTGNHDGSPAVDYTVNPSSGFPTATGPPGGVTNHVLPAWDVAAGLYLALAVVGAERERRATGEGQAVTLALSDVMLATVANLGYLAEVQVNDTGREPTGNYVYGAFGRDFATADGRRVMIAAMTGRQWTAITTATGLAERLAHIEPMLGVDLSTDGGRYQAREAIAAVLSPWFARHTLSEIEDLLTRHHVLYGVYRDFGQLVAEDPRCSLANPLFAAVDQPGIGKVLTPRSPMAFGRGGPGPAAAPVLGGDTAAVLTEHLGRTSEQVRSLLGRNVVSDPTCGATT